jgi:hypothetical protein
VKSIVIYSREGCHLCDIMIEELLPLIRDRLDLIVQDVDSRHDWYEKYDTRVPVMEYDGELICQYHLDREALARILSKHQL